MLLKNYIFCDDIRQEINNKFSLIGAYSDRILITTPKGVNITWPISLRLSIYLRIGLDKQDIIPNNFDFSLHLKNKTLINVAGNPYTIDTERRDSNIFITTEGLQVEPGDLDFNLSLKKDSQLVYDVEVKSALSIQYNDGASQRSLS